MSVAVQVTLQGMPESSDLRRTVHDGRTVLTVGSRVLADYDRGDVGMRNIAVVTLTELGFAGQRVAEVVGLTPQYVSMLRSRARQEGSAGLVRTRGRRPKLSVADARRARAWRGQGLSDVQIGRRLGVSDKTAAHGSAEFGRWRHPQHPTRDRSCTNGQTPAPKTYQVPIPKTNPALLKGPLQDQHPRSPHHPQRSGAT